MNYAKIAEYFASDEKIEELLEALKKDYFDVIDDYTQQIAADIISTIEDLRKAKTALTVIYASLQPIYSKALTLKKQKEYRYFVEHKDEGSAASMTVASKDAVRLYRDVRDIIFGYLKAAESLIYDCKDRIEQSRKEYNTTKEEN